MLRALTGEPLPSAGFSNASIARVTLGEQRFVLKRTTPARDWTACRSGDARGREALLLADGDCAGVWDVFDCPYVAYEIGEGEIALMMRDLTAHLLPDTRTPLRDEQQTAILGAIARLHARFWDWRAPAGPWLARVENYCDLLPPSYDCALLPSPLREHVRGGWAAAMARVPGEVAEKLTRPGCEWARQWDDLPKTLLHGDVKVANFAIVGDDRVAAFDWAMCGVGPCSVDLGWYLAVNASRLAGTKEDVIKRYRALLTGAPASSPAGAAASRRRDGGGPAGETPAFPVINAVTWRRLEDAAIVLGARMLLWSKAAALEAGRAGAQEEWNWWMERLRG